MSSILINCEGTKHNSLETESTIIFHNKNRIEIAKAIEYIKQNHGFENVIIKSIEFKNW